jgi:hypothetical protein
MLAHHSGIMMRMRTTLTLDDDVLKAARRRARDQDRPLKDVINEALRQGLALGKTRPPAYRFKLKTVEGRLLPGVDLTDRDKLFDLLEHP